MDTFFRQGSALMEFYDAPVIQVFRNGDHSRQCEVILKPSITFTQLREQILHKLGLRDNGNFRLFNGEGIELYEDYIPLIKRNERLYASTGENFDKKSSMADYKEISLLGEGGFGRVLLMEYTPSGKKFAVKFVDARKYGLASLIDLVFKEAELLKNLNHRHIVEIVNFFALNDMRVIFVMEYLEGGELGEFLKQKGTLQEEEARGIFKQLTEAVHFCHMNNIIHRDLKLENILFESKGQTTIKVVDFGIAGFYSNTKGGESNAGSLRYMAPEVLSGRNQAANPSIDVWSMGVILYALLHGSLPFNGTTRKDITSKILRGDYQIDTNVKKRISPECQDILSKMLTVDYKKRITTFDIKCHPWVTGNRNISISTWTESTVVTDNSKPDLEDEEEKAAKVSKRPVRGSALCAILNKNKTPFGSSVEREVYPKVKMSDYEKRFSQRKSTSKDHHSLHEFLSSREKKDSIFASEGKRKGGRRLMTFEETKVKDARDGLGLLGGSMVSGAVSRVITPKKLIFPPIMGTVSSKKNTPRRK